MIYSIIRKKAENVIKDALEKSSSASFIRISDSRPDDLGHALRRGHSRLHGLYVSILLSDYFPATERPSARISGAPKTVTPDG